MPHHNGKRGRYKEPGVVLGLNISVQCSQNIGGVMAIVCLVLQVPPDFYIPDFDEDEQNPDERMDRKYNWNNVYPRAVASYCALINICAHFGAT